MQMQGLHWWHVLFYKLHPLLVRSQIVFEQLQRNCHKISIWLARDATINLVRANIDMFLYKHDCAVWGNSRHNHILLLLLLLLLLLYKCEGRARRKVWQLNKFIWDADFLIKYDKQRRLVYIFKWIFCSQTLLEEELTGRPSEEALIIMSH